MSQNIWEHKKDALHRQKRRAQLVSSYLKRSSAKRILDIGCAEGYATSFIAKTGALVIGVEVDLTYLNIAKGKVKNVEFVNSSINYLPFRPGFFDAVCILEVLEHVDTETQKSGLKDVDRTLRKGGTLIISVPYNEKIISTKCIHCGKVTPLYGHLHSLDEGDINRILPHSQYKLIRTYRLPNVEIICCNVIFEPLPLPAWILLNSVLGHIRKGYWIILHYNRE